MKFIRGRLGGFLEIGHTKIIKKFMIIIFAAGRFLLSRGFSFIAFGMMQDTASNLMMMKMQQPVVYIRGVW